MAPIETEFGLFVAPSGQRRKIVYGNRGFWHIVQDFDLSHHGPSFQRLSADVVFSWLQLGGFGLVVGFPLWGPFLVLVAKPKEGPARQKKAKKKRKIGLGGGAGGHCGPPFNPLR